MAGGWLQPSPKGNRLLAALLMSFLLVHCVMLTAHGHAGHVHEEDEYDYGDEASPVAAGPPKSPPPPPVDLQSGDLIANKIGALVAFFFVPFISCWVPVIIRIDMHLLKFGVLFAAGLFFSLAVQHLLSDAVSGLKYLIKKKSDYPFGFLLLVVGYFLTWLSDMVARAIFERKEEQKKMLVEEKAKLVPPGASPDSSDAAASSDSSEAPSAVSCCKQKSAAVRDEESAMSEKEVTGDAQRRGECTREKCPCDGIDCRCAEPSGLEYDMPKEFLRTKDAVASATGGKKQTEQTDGNQPMLSGFSMFDVLFLVLAMCFHGIFEGLAVGLANSVSAVWTVTLSVIIHKIFEGLALGATLRAQNPDRPHLNFALYAAGFSITVPIGISIGIIINSASEPTASQWINSIGNGIASGVFVYVAITHMMIKAMKPGNTDKWWTPFLKYAAAAFGVVVNSLLQLIH